MDYLKAGAPSFAGAHGRHFGDFGDFDVGEAGPQTAAQIGPVDSVSHSVAPRRAQIGQTQLGQRNPVQMQP